MDQLEINMVMLGHTGAGKSSTGNSILGDKIFDSYTGITSMTSDVTRHRIHNEAFRIRDHDDKEIYLADTPGFFDTRSRDVQNRIKTWLEKFKPHVFLLVISLKNRFPKEAEATLDRIESIFGEKMYRKCVVVFSGADYLKETSIDSFVRSEVHPKVAQLIHRCGNRYAAIDNYAERTKRDEQVALLAEVVSEIPNIDEPFDIPSSFQAASSVFPSPESITSVFNSAKEFLLSTSIPFMDQKRTNEDKVPVSENYDDDSEWTMLDIDAIRAKRKRYKRRDYLKRFVFVFVAILICIFLLWLFSSTSDLDNAASRDNIDVSRADNIDVSRDKI